MKNRNSTKITCLCLVAFFLAITLMTAGAPAAGPNDPPDLTQVETKEIDLDRGTYNLGSTGLRGWIFTKAANYLDSVQGRTTTASRQILVTHVGVKSPADGMMKVNDVILGAGGKIFTDDARKSIALAIQEAEKAANGGILKLTRWRSGKTEDVQLKLRVMGSYSDTAPFNCRKSKRIFEEACKHLEKEPLQENLWGAINGLALLSTGKSEYLPKVRAFARKIGPKTLKLELKKGMVVWDWGYKNLFLCEYYLRTGDKEVLHAINQYTVSLAKGQGMYGTFGHGLSDLTPDGRLHGSIPPYGPVNQCGLTGNLAILMGKKCGADDPEIDPAIERALKFFGYFVDKGAIPYGEHAPWPYHGSNGKTAQAAILFALQGDRIDEARFFAKMTTASYNNRQYGHTGQGFSYLWTALGANTGGPAAMAAFFKEASWHLDLVRRCDGSFTYDGGEQYGPGKTDDDTYYGKSSYNGLSPNATYVLTYSLPLKNLYITGRTAKRARWLSTKDVSEAIASGRFDLDRKNMDVKDLVAAFGDWSPIVRGWAAEELARRPEARSMTAALIKMAGGDDVHVAQSACETLGYLNIKEALPVMVRLLKHDDHWLRYKAAEALNKMRDTARPALNDMLQIVIDTAQPIERIAWDDPIQLSHGQLANALFGGLLSNSIEGVEKKVLYSAIRAIAQNPDGRARANLKGTFEKLLTLEDVEALAPDLMDAIIVPAPADTMFRDSIRMGAFKALTKYKFKEAVEAGVIYAKTQGGHGSESRTELIMKEIVSYGSAARSAIPGLKELIVQFNEEVKRREFPRGSLNNRRVGAVEDAIKAIEAAKDHPKLWSISDKIMGREFERSAESKKLDLAGLKLGTWHRIGPFRDKGPLLNWMDNVESSFKTVFEAEKDALDADGQALLSNNYAAGKFPLNPRAVRSWQQEPEWIDGYYQELPRGPAPSAGESQYVYREINVERDVEVILDFIIRAPESDRRMDKPRMEHWRRTGRFRWWVNGKEISRWEGRGDMPKAQKVQLKKGKNFFLAKLTNNRHSYGFAFSIFGLHPDMRHEVGFERLWRNLQQDKPSDVPFFVENGKTQKETNRLVLYRDALNRLKELKFHPEPMPGVEHAAINSQGKVVAAMEKELEKYPTSPLGDRHTARLAKLEKKVKPLLNKIITSGEPMVDEVIAICQELDNMWSQTISELPKLIFLNRHTYTYDSMMFTKAGRDAASIRSFDPKSRKLETLYQLPGNHKAHEINVSWDGKKVFIGGGGKVMSVGIDGKDFRVITSGQSPSEMPDGRIVFFDNDTGQSPCKGGSPRQLLFICDPEGNDRKAVSVNLTIDTSPSIMNDGRVIFARWDYGVNKNVFNRHAIWMQNPDGTGMDLFFGNTIIDPRSFGRPRQVPSRPEVLTIFGPHHAKLAGLVGLVYNGKGKEAADGLGFRRLTHDTASVGDRPPEWAFQDAEPVNEQLFLASFGGNNTKKAGLYIIDRSGNRKCVLETAGGKGVHSVQLLSARKKPPVIPDRSTNPNWIPHVDLHHQLLNDPDWTQKSTLLMQDVYQGLEPEIKRGQAKYLAVMQQPAQSHGRGGAMGVGTIWYANRCVGLVPIEEDGSAYFQVPAMRSLYFHVLDKDGKMLMTQGSDFHTMPGESRSCIGCHEQRKGKSVPINPGKRPIAGTKPPVRPVMPEWGTNGIIEYETVVQPVFDKYCVSCHSGAKPDGKLDLTGDRTVVYNMSYMQLTDKSLVHFTPGTGATHAQPSNDYDHQAPLSRGSLLSKLTGYLQDLTHCRKKIPFDDQLKVFLWIDSNVPFYSHYRHKSPTVLKENARKQLTSVYQKRCASCHNQPDRPDTRSGLNRYHSEVHVGGRPGQWGITDSGMRVWQMNLTNPQNSATLQAPLSIKAGGWETCRTEEGKPVFKDKNDPDYKNILNALKQVDRRNGIIAAGIKELLSKENKDTEDTMDIR